MVDIPGGSFFPSCKCSICLWHCHCAVILPFPYTLSAPSHVTLPIPVAPGPSELSCWEPGRVVWDRKQQRPWSHLRNLKNSIPTRYCTRLWRNEGKTDLWPQGVNGRFVCFFFFPPLQRRPDLVKFYLCRVFPTGKVIFAIYIKLMVPNFAKRPHCSKKGRRQWQPIPVLLLGKSHGRRSLVGCSPWGR